MSADDTPTAEPLLAKYVCAACGTEFVDAAFDIMGHNFLARDLCDACAKEQQDAKEALKRMEQALTRRSAVRSLLGDAPALLPLDYDARGTNVDHPDFPKARWEEIKRWRPNSLGNFWLGLEGKSGRCKTRIMALLAALIIERSGKPCIWLPAHRLDQLARDKRSRDFKTKDTAERSIREAQTAAYLFLDDLGTTDWAPAFEAELYAIFDFRINKFLPTIYSSNERPEEYALCLSKANRDRIIGRWIDKTERFYFE